MKQCKHVWDIFTRLWTVDGERAIPCKKCDALHVIGRVKVEVKP